MSIIEDELFSSSVIKDVHALDFDFIPDELPHREDKMKRMAQIFKPLLTGVAQTAVIRGPVGSGKTVMAKKFTSELCGLASKHGVSIDYIHINCRKRSTDSLVMIGILNHFDERFPDRGFSVQEMLTVLKKQLIRRETQLVIVLDEADSLIRRSGSDLIYSLTRFTDESLKADNIVSVIMISQKDVLGMLDEAALSTFKRANNILLEPYGRDDLVDILNTRVDLAFHIGTISDDSISLIADIAGDVGDARFAIELLWKSGASADENHRERVLPDDVRAAKAETYSVVTESKLNALGRQQLLTLLSVAKRLEKDEEAAYATTGEVEKMYKVSCEEYGEDTRGHTSFWKYLKDIEDAGFIDLRASGKGVVGSTQLISLPDVPAGVLAGKVEHILTS